MAFATKTEMFIWATKFQTWLGAFTICVPTQTFLTEFRQGRLSMALPTLQMVQLRCLRGCLASCNKTHQSSTFWMYICRNTLHNAKTWSKFGTYASTQNELHDITSFCITIAKFRLEWNEIQILGSTFKHIDIFLQKNFGKRSGKVWW